MFIPLLLFRWEAGLGSFWNFPRDALSSKKLEFGGISVARESFQHLGLEQGEARGCTRNSSVGKTQDTKITPTPTSHGGNPNILTPSGPLPWSCWHKGGFAGTRIPLSIWKQL